MSVHERFDLGYWLSEFTLDKLVEQYNILQRSRGVPVDSDWLPDVSVISSPAHMAIAEQLREKIHDSGQDLGPSSPVDIFLWRICRMSKGPVTRIGGRPFRNPNNPWPTSTSGNPLPFLAQISFLDSKDIVPEDVPGDVLSMYGTWTGENYIDMESFVIEWTSVDDGQDHVNCALPEWNFCAEGVIHRTTSYPNCDELVHDLGIAVPDVLQATQIGKYPFRIQGEGLDESIVFASFSSLQPNQSWPFINCSALPKFIYPKGHEGYLDEMFSMMIGDMGSVNFYKNKAGKFTHSWDCY